MEIILIAIIGGLVVIISVVMLVVVVSRLRQLERSSSIDYLKGDVTELARSVASLQTSLGDRFDRSNQSIQTSVQRQLSESAKLVADVTQRLGKLDETNRRVVDVADELKTLQNVLQNPKQRGVFGEFYLESVLENILPAKNYQMQYRFRDGQIVDAVVRLDKGKLLPIDSKFSLENYNRMVGEKQKSARENSSPASAPISSSASTRPASTSAQTRIRWTSPLCSSRASHSITTS